MPDVESSGLPEEVLALARALQDACVERGVRFSAQLRIPRGDVALLVACSGLDHVSFARALLANVVLSESPEGRAALAESLVDGLRAFLSSLDAVPPESVRTVAFAERIEAKAKTPKAVRLPMGPEGRG